jgi:hypothetical protein
VIRPTAAPAGSTVEMTGNTPLFAKSGRYVGPTGKIGFWFNLPFGDWVHVYFGQVPRSSNKGAPVIDLGEANVEGKCSYRVAFTVPNVPPGRYQIVPIQHGRGSSAAFRSIDLRVTR